MTAPGGPAALSNAPVRDSHVVVFAPSPVVTVTVEAGADAPEIHFHAGGQGFWIARLIAELGVRVVLCGSFGGESGAVAATLIEAESSVAVRAIGGQASNPAYVHDRRGGERQVLAETEPVPLSRHELDELYGAVLVESLSARVCVLAGTTAAGDVVPADLYRRLASDLSSNGCTVVADLSGAALANALVGGVTAVKVSDTELVDAGYARSRDRDDVVAAIRELPGSRRPRAIVVSRADQPAVAALDDHIVEIVAPRFEALDERGGGDSMTAGIAAALATGDDIEVAIQLGAAAGSLNVTRRGLATGGRADILELARYIELQPLAAHDRDRTTTPDELAARARPNSSGP
jgi:1-phosphofructokinase